MACILTFVVLVYSLCLDCISFYELKRIPFQSAARPIGSPDYRFYIYGWRFHHLIGSILDFCRQQSLISFSSTCQCSVLVVIYFHSHFQQISAVCIFLQFVVLVACSLFMYNLTLSFFTTNNNSLEIIKK